MAFKQVIEICDLLDRPKIDIGSLKNIFLQRGVSRQEILARRVRGEKGETHFLKIILPGRAGKSRGKRAPTLGIIGRLGGVGARPHRIGLVSDADGAITALSAALKIAEMRRHGDMLAGDVFVSTHLCPCSPIIPHDPVPFMGSPISMEVMNAQEVDPRMDAILSIDTTKGNRIINQRGFAISPTVKDGYILRVSEDLLDIMQVVTGKLPAVLPITTQDVTPYGNGLYHLNSIMQPATATHAPVVGVAITAEAAVPGCATGASQCTDIEMAARFCVEVAKAFGQGNCRFYDPEEFERIAALYGFMEHLQSPGKKAGKKP
jgi:hypothetical protein